MGTRQEDRDYRRDRRRHLPSLYRRDERAPRDRESSEARDRREDVPRNDRRRDEPTSRNTYHRRSRSRSPKEAYGHRKRRSSSADDRARPRDNHHEEHSNRLKRHGSFPSRSPSPRRISRRSPSPKTTSPFKRSKAPLPSQQAAFTGDPITGSSVSKSTAPPIEKQKPNFAPSGALAAETNTVAGTTIVLKYNEPPESRKPPASQPWRLFVFKGSETLDTLELASRSCWLFGREKNVVDYPIEHPSCSKQHAVLQFRYVEKKNEFGDKEGGVRPYMIDLESANGTKVNGEKVPERRFVELMSGDVLVFGDSTREYVLILPPKG
ncbi:hypothetical protein MMC30_007301 [Trapelia coarctata]|nr:hypothetical protein [Trapelia coarctata]